MAQLVTFGATWIAMALYAAPALVVLVAACAATTLTVTRPTQRALIGTRP